MTVDLLSIYGQMMGFVKQFYWTMQQFWSFMFTPLCGAKARFRMTSDSALESLYSENRV